jgi:hypothetical protein
MVHLQRFHQQYARDGLAVTVISMHPDADAARTQTAGLKVTYPIFNGHGSDLGRLYAYG